MNPPLLVCARTMPGIVTRCLMCAGPFTTEAAVVMFVVGDERLGTLCEECGLSCDADRRVFDDCRQRWQQ